MNFEKQIGYCTSLLSFKFFATRAVLKIGKYLTNRFHIAVCLFSNRSQMTSKCDEDKKSGTQGDSRNFRYKEKCV